MKHTFTILKTTLLTSLIVVFTLSIQAQENTNPRDKLKPKRRNNTKIQFEQLTINADGTRSIYPVRDTLFIDLPNSSLAPDTLACPMFIFAVPTQNPRQVNNVIFKLRRKRTIVRNDRTPPFSFSLNKRTEFDFSKLRPGSYTLTATPYIRNRKGPPKGETEKLVIIVSTEEEDTSVASGTTSRALTNSYEFNQNDIPFNPSLQMEVYPNPSSGIVEVSWIGIDHSRAELSIFSSLGQIIYQRQVDTEMVNQIDLQHLKKGLYFVNLRAENQVITKRIIIQ